MRKFFSRITGGGDQYDDYFDDPREMHFNLQPQEGQDERRGGRHPHNQPAEESYASEANELAVDVYQTPDAIVIKALLAGVQPQSIDISLTREMVTISGSRQEEREVEENDYFQRELFWGSFSRTILLPEEIDVDAAEASEKHGVLMLRLPKINKTRQTKLKVRSR